MTTDQATTDTVSRNAHERIVAERDDFKAKLAEASAALSDLTKVRTVEQFFASKGQDIAKAQWNAEMALPHLRDVEPGDIPTLLESERFAPMWNQPSVPTTEPAPRPEPAPAVEPPSSAFATGPAPAADGTVPQVPKLTIHSPEMQQAIAANDGAQLDKWDKEGRINWSPNNQYANPPPE